MPKWVNQVSVQVDHLLCQSSIVGDLLTETRPIMCVSVSMGTIFADIVASLEYPVRNSDARRYHGFGYCMMYFSDTYMY